jgi:hypothetical protein
MAGRDAFRSLEHEADLCVVGGGVAGLVAALAAARHGAQVVLMHERPVLGGNASSECRVPIEGASRGSQLPHMRETGILEELCLENCRRNPHKEYSLWDLVLYEKVQYQPNLTLLLNCTCLDAEMEGSRIRTVTGWQLTTQTYHTVRARIFADCSGDGVLAPLTQHPFRMGREARSEYGESIAPEEADTCTMGMTCFVGAREHDAPQPFEPPDWAYRYDSIDELPFDPHGRAEIDQAAYRLGFWWVELGGNRHSIHDTEELREELLRIALGVWDHLKNRGQYGADNWALDWIQFLPGKRESRRYVGAHVLTQGDLESGGQFEDVVGYGGWTMDDHHPAGFYSVKLGQPATIYHPTPSPYGIPYRSLYSDTVKNLMFAGRCHSATHAALSSTRVMGTCATMGQAIGTAAAMAAARSLLPGDMLDHMGELQQTLLRNDCYLPGVEEEVSEVVREARLSASQGDAEPVRDGVRRQVKDDPHAWVWRPGDWVACEFGSDQRVDELSLVLDSAMETEIILSHYNETACDGVPAAMPKQFRVEVKAEGQWELLQEVRGNYQRFVRLPVHRSVAGVRVTLDGLWAADESRLYGLTMR